MAKAGPKHSLAVKKLETAAPVFKKSRRNIILSSNALIVESSAYLTKCVFRDIDNSTTDRRHRKFAYFGPGLSLVAKETFIIQEEFYSVMAAGFHIFLLLFGGEERGVDIIGTYMEYPG